MLADQALLEREREIDAIRAAVAGAHEARGSVVLLEGPPGVGKTSLLRRALTEAAAEGMRALTASGAEFERDFPFGVARQLFERAIADLSAAERRRALAGVAAPVGALFTAESADESRASDPFPLVHGLYWLAANLSAEAPLLLAVDDVQWSDELSVRWLAYLARRIETLPVAVVVAARRAEHGMPRPPLDALWGAPDVVRLAPEALSPTAVRLVLGTEIGKEPGKGFAEACYEVTGGNPFFVSELTRALVADRIPPDDEQAARLSDMRLPGVQTSVLVRLGQLPDAAVALARAVAALGGSTGLREAAATAELDAVTAADAVEQLAGAGILDRGVPLRFVHPVVLSSVHDDLGAAQCVALHDRAARALRDLGASRERIAAQLMLAEPGPEEWRRQALREAASQALALGTPEVAVAYLGRAVETAPPDARRSLLIELGLAEARIGGAEAAEHLLEAHRASTTLDERVESARALAVALGPIGRGGEAAAVLEEVAEESAGADRERHLLLEGESAAFAVLDRPRIPRARKRLADVAEGLTGQTPGERAVLAVFANLQMSAGVPVSEMGPLAVRALADGALVREQPERPTPHMALDTAAHAGYRDVCERELEGALAEARRRGSVFGFLIFSATRAYMAWLLWGDVEQAEEYAAQAIDAAAESGLGANFPSAVAALAAARIEQGRLNDASALLEENGLAGELPLMALFSNVSYTRAQLRLARGDWSGAAEDFLYCGELFHGDPLLPYRAGAALALSGAGDEDRALALAEEEVERLARVGAALHHGVALRALALVRGCDAATLKKAVELLAKGGNPLEHARALVDLGAAMRREGRRADSRQPLLEGLDLAHRAGASALEARAKDELAALGARPRRAVLTGVGALTASERRVARLAAQGLSNPEIGQTLFVTRKTVEMHLSHVYGKLGITSRNELPAALAERRADL